MHSKLPKLLAFCCTLAGLTHLPQPAEACSDTTACLVDGGEYYIKHPETEIKASDAKQPAVIYIHGFGGSGEGVFRNTGMTQAFLDRGYTLIAPSGMEMPTRNGRTWSFHPDRTQLRDEVTFLQTVRDDVIAQHNIDPDRIILSGFSIGGSMVSYLACAAPTSFPAYAPIGGSFWRPHPNGCEGHVRLLHTHGWTDGTVPLEGRVLRGGDITHVGALAQGDVFHAMDIWRQTNDCIFLKADSYETEGLFWRRKWDRCLPGSALEFALYPGGHSIPKGWADMVVDWFEAL